MRAARGFLQALRDLLLTKVDRDHAPGRHLGLEATDLAGFDRHIARVIATQTGFDGRRDGLLTQSGPVADNAPPSRPVFLTDAEHGRRLVAGIAAMRDVALFVRLSHSEAAAQAEILQDLLNTARIVPYRVDADGDPAIRRGLPLPDDHPAPLVLYIRGRAVGDFVAATDALRDGTLAARLLAAGITHDAAALRALQDSLQKA